ncbi:Hsp20/alpha crystallin family protein [Streptomyces sp. NPDC052682]|uniref:Hsp20/alpha crystallin family protein n=1 Tax=Streptomyces sp. NPDC052682 TaxID=3154954 RepID=UPI003414B6AD
MRRPERGLWDWNSFTEAGNLVRDEGGDDARERGAWPAVWGGGARVPVVEEEETDDACVLRAALPGIPRQTVSVEADEGDLWIFGCGRLLCRVGLPAGVDPGRIEADLTDGVLSVRLPRAGTVRRRRIPIGGSG